MLKNMFTYDDGGVKPWVKYAALVIAVGAGGYFVYTGWSSEDASQEVTMMCLTEGCDYKTSRPLEFGEVLPAKCPKCGKNSLVPAFTCKGCGKPLILNEDRGLKPPTICPYCGKEVWYGR